MLNLTLNPLRPISGINLEYLVRHRALNVALMVFNPLLLGAFDERCKATNTL